MYSDFTVFVTGDGMLDEWVEGESFENEAGRKEIRMVNPTVERTLGGAYNLAVNLKSLGANVVFFGALPRSEPEYAEFVEREFKKHNIEGVFVYCMSSHPVIQQRHFRDGEYTTWFTFTKPGEAPRFVTEELISRMEIYKQRIGKVDALAIWDYDEGLMTSFTISSMLDWARLATIPIFVDPKIEHFWDYRNVRVFKCNLSEAVKALNPPGGQASLPSSLRNYLECNYAIITHGAEGMDYTTPSVSRFVQSRKVDKDAVVCDVGAGDTTFAAIILEYLATHDIDKACEVGNTAGSIAVTKPRCGSITIEELKCAGS